MVLALATWSRRSRRVPSLWAQALIGFVPWNIYDMSSIVVIAGLTHVPHAYLYISSALRSVAQM
jgi:ABC-type Fe3+ transport system permease subunit